MFGVDLVLVVEVAVLIATFLLVSPENVQGFSNNIFYSFSNRIPQQQQRQRQPQRQQRTWQNEHRQPLLWGATPKQYEDDHDDLDDERAALEECGGDPSFLEDNTGNNDDDDYYYDSARDDLMEEILENGGDLSFLLEEDAWAMPEQPPRFVTRLEDLGGGGEPKIFLDPPPDSMVEKSSSSMRESSSTSSFLVANFAQRQSSVTNPMQGGMHTRREEDDQNSLLLLADKNHERTTAEELEQMGGDPAFLDPESESQNDIFDEIAKMGGDPSFLEGYVEPEMTEQKETADPSFLQSLLDAKEPMQTTEINPTGPYRTAVEGETYNSPMEELEALGGDPFFLDQQDENVESDIGYNDFDSDDEAVPTTTISSLAPAEDPSFLMSHVQKHTKDATDECNTIIEEATIPEDDTPEMEWSNDRIARDEIEEMGGDPSFL